MKMAGILIAVLLSTTLMVAGCDKQQSPVEGAKDALDLREHEKLKDAGEDAAEAVENAVEGIKEEVDGN